MWCREYRTSRNLESHSPTLPPPPSTAATFFPHSTHHIISTYPSPRRHAAAVAVAAAVAAAAAVVVAIVVAVVPLDAGVGWVSQAALWVEGARDVEVAFLSHRHQHALPPAAAAAAGRGNSDVIQHTWRGASATTCGTEPTERDSMVPAEQAQAGASSNLAAAAASRGGGHRQDDEE